MDGLNEFQKRIQARMEEHRRQHDAKVEAFLASGGECADCFDQGPCEFCERGRAIAETDRERQRQEAIAGWLGRSGVSPRMRRFTFSSFPLKDDAAYLAMREFTMSFDWSQSLILTGRYGTGKTGLLASALAYLGDSLHKWDRFAPRNETQRGPEWVLFPAERSARFMSTTALFDDLRMGYDDGRFTEVMRQCQNVDLLILDDLGAEKPTDWVRERLFAIINHRYEHEKPTWASTNLTLESLEQSAGERVVWRLAESAQIITVNGANLRERAA